MKGLSSFVQAAELAHSPTAYFLWAAVVEFLLLFFRFMRQGSLERTSMSTEVTSDTYFPAQEQVLTRSLVCSCHCSTWKFTCSMTRIPSPPRISASRECHSSAWPTTSQSRERLSFARSGLLLARYIRPFVYVNVFEAVFHMCTLRSTVQRVVPWVIAVQRAKQQFIFLTQENLDSLDCVRLQVDHNASRARSHDALRHSASSWHVQYKNFWQDRSILFVSL